MDENTYAGINITLPKFNDWSSKQIYDPQAGADYSNFEEIEKALTRARMALFRINDKINEYERKEKLAKKEYERNYKRYYLGSTEKTEAAKKARAEIKCEELENEWLAHEQLRIELVRMSFALKDDIGILQTLSYTLRAQMS